MNYRTDLSIQYAQQRNYLDDLFSVYPTIPEGIRDIDQSKRKEIEKSFDQKDSVALLQHLLSLPLFPIKDSYIAYLKKDKSAILKNPKTVQRICGRIYEMGLNEIEKKCSEPKETNRQIGPFFKRWINKGSLGIMPITKDAFLANNDNAILDASDAGMKDFAKEFLGYTHIKGLDFVARFNGKYIIGEAKFLTDIGGHQTAQYNDAISTITAKDTRAISIAILDGVLYIKGKNKMYLDITNPDQDRYIMSALVLRDFLYQI